MKVGWMPPPVSLALCTPAAALQITSSCDSPAYLSIDFQNRTPLPLILEVQHPMDFSETTGLLSPDFAKPAHADAGQAVGSSPLHMASAPSDSVTRNSGSHDAPTAPPSPLHPKLTNALQLMRQGNYREAIPLLEQAAADGSAEADVELAECFGLGWGTSPNPARALYHANRSAGRGNLDGHFMAAW